MKIWCVDAVAAGHATSQKRPKLGLTFYFFFVNTQLSVKSWCETKIQTDTQNEK